MKHSSTRRFVLVAAVSIVVVLPTYVRAFTVSGASDAPTLLRGDKVLVNEAAYWLRLPYSPIRLLHVARPRRGDLVRVRRPDLPVFAFKRVIGLPGETIEIREDRIMIDGRLLPLRELPRTDFAWVPKSHTMGSNVFDEDGHWAAFTPGAQPDRNMSALRLRSDEYFLLGDNRDASLDCRTWGPLKEDAIFGKIVFMIRSGPRSLGKAH
jgi:signal peptidase I